MKQQNNERGEKYKALREVGFTSREANLLKDRTWDKVNKYIAFQKEYILRRNAILTEDGKGKKW